MIGVISFALIALILGTLIVFLNEYLFNTDNDVKKIEEMLPGYNCWTCGFGSCKGMAEAIIKDKEAINKCRILKNKDEILKYMGE